MMKRGLSENFFETNLAGSVTLGAPSTARLRYSSSRSDTDELLCPALAPRLRSAARRGSPPTRSGRNAGWTAPRRTVRSMSGDARCQLLGANADATSEGVSVYPRGFGGAPRLQADAAWSFRGGRRSYRWSRRHAEEAAGSWTISIPSRCSRSVARTGRRGGLLAGGGFEPPRAPSIQRSDPVTKRNGKTRQSLPSTAKRVSGRADGLGVPVISTIWSAARPW